jgi:DNA-binding transcriptional ArsR family regulator
MMPTSTITKPYAPPQMSDRLKRLLREGNDGTYKSDFAYEWAITLAAVNAGHSEAWLRKVLIDRGPNYHAIAKQHGKGKADRYVSTLYEKAEQYRKEHPPWRSKQDVSAELSAYRDWLATLPIWRGQKNSRNLAVLRAVVQIGVEVGSTVVSFSVRQLAERAGKSKNTILKALPTLTKDGWLLLVQPASFPKAATYRIVLGSAWNVQPWDTNTYILSWGVGSSVPTLHALFTGDGVGDNAVRVYLLLDHEEGVKVKALVQTTRLHESTIRRALARLFSAGLAYKKDGVWLRLEADQRYLDEVADLLGVTERQAKRKARHVKDRENEQRRIGHEERINAEGVSQARIQAREGAVVPTAGTTDRAARGTALPERDPQSLPRDHGPNLPVEQGQGMGRDTAPVLANHGAKQPVRRVGLAEGWERPEPREAACVDCGQVQTFSAPDLRPYSCAYCKGKFVFVDELAIVAA